MTQAKPVIQNKATEDLIVQNEELKDIKSTSSVVIKKEKIKKVILKENEPMSIHALARTALPGFILLWFIFLMCHIVGDFSSTASFLFALLGSLFCVGYNEEIMQFVLAMYAQDIPSLYHMVEFVKNFRKNKYSVKQIFSNLSFKQKKNKAEKMLGKSFLRQQDLLYQNDKKIGRFKTKN